MTNTLVSTLVRLASALAVLAKRYGAKEWDSPEALETIGKLFRIKL